MTPEDLAGRLFKVRESLARACRDNGRRPEDVLLVAVSKFHPASDIAAVAAAGQRDFGENYVQEALEKRAELADDPAAARIRWHMIGHVQSRKAAQVAGAFVLIHTLDSVKLADALERRLAVTGQLQPVLMEINIGAEPQKAGVMPEAAEALGAHVLAACPHLELRGLMCLPPVFDAGEAARPYFARLRRLGEDLRSQLGVAMPELSMGMSGDFAAAVAEGATIVRIGTDIFGPRPPKAPAPVA
ncbi:MAG: YggS family pyridoxal phosphate-dependent enzyme [Desulfovibrio sp.]|uniref:YggS family pyridoxal phosphate-dependent enzyme n=1 Tax=Desulfovibrio sp. TaxID=885 RepID=UPI001A76E281|nr:YggS family pyridoxal phosphate-dependent enzyme [Desulfovibrio sp.]MBD5417658.1 YggS family pyridoxal phosphate-dependent enzyme [Desulfovibrio sp.]